MVSSKRQSKNASSSSHQKRVKAEKPDTNEAKAKQRKELDEKVASSKLHSSRVLHFAPWPLLLTIMICSGGIGLLSYRDVFATGKVIFGSMDDAMLHFTKSTKWFDDTRGWKSTQGGFSAIKSMTTDENDMGGFFVRKVAGAASLGFQLQKLIPFLFQPSDAHFGLGHFNALLFTSVLGNIASAGLYLLYLEDFKAMNAHDLGFYIIFAFVVESVVMLGYALSTILKKPTKQKDVTLPNGKGPRSLVSNILARTIFIVSGLLVVIAGRDLFFPGQELAFPPFDEIYLEWTGAFIHSPPPNSPEEDEHGLEAPLHVGDKFCSQLMALNLLITCFQKFVSCFVIRLGKDGSGKVKSNIFWRSQTYGNALLLFVIRVFASPAKTASFDLRWHLMMLGYETFMLGLYSHL